MAGTMSSKGRVLIWWSLLGDAVALSHEAFTKAFLGTEIRHSVQGRPRAVTTSLIAAEDEHYVIEGSVRRMGSLSFHV